jgi:HK97 family phage major capsid protein
MSVDVIMKRLDAMDEALKVNGSRPRGNGMAGVIGKAHVGGWNQSDDNGWPTEKLKHLADTYDSVGFVESQLRKRDGRFRISDMGPALVRLAALSGNQEAKAAAITQGMSETYSNENFEKEYGFTPWVKATQQGVTGQKWGLGPNQVRKVALAEGSGLTGGYVVPPQFMNELLTIAAEDGFIEQRAKVIPMNSRTAQWPMLDITTAQAGGTSPYFGGILAQWQPEAATINETEPQFKQTEWIAWDLVLYTVSSNQLLADNGIGLDALLTQLFGQAITWYKEFAFLQGKGAGSTMPLGVINAPAAYVQQKQVAGHFTLADVASMMSHLQVRSWDDACWVMHQSVIPDLIQMSDISTAPPGSAGQHLVWLPPLGADGKGPASGKLPNALLNGLPIFFTEKLPSMASGVKGYALLVDWSRYVIGQRLDMQIDVSPHYLFRNNQLAWRVVARCDGKPWLNNVITDQAGWQVSPFVVLQG